MKSLKYFVCIIGVLLLTFATASAQGDAGCLKSDCHDNMAIKEFVHGPVGAGACTVCHAPVEGKDHKFEFFAQKDELCFACHEDRRDMMLKDNVHRPVAEGNCVGCHDPHQSDFRYTLKGQAADLCLQCHDASKFNKEFVHGPVAGGDCNVCHNPHASDHVYQLVEAPETLCFVCHVELADIPSFRHQHESVEEKCTNCHNPHSNTNKMLLPKAVPELCFDCHGDLTDHEVEHPPAATGQCGKCHQTHGSDNPKLFTMPAKDLCLSCHEEEKQYLANQANKHGPIKDGDCNACHSPHGSENYRILKKNFPEEFYMPYDTENYAICFECHNKSIALDSTTKTLTDFRNGDVNLHYLHVNKEKGRSCKACHHPHATNQAKHIRTSVPYGSMDWELPVTYTKFADGGKCVVGCHAPKEYHRK